MKEVYKQSSFEQLVDIYMFLYFLVYLKCGFVFHSLFEKAMSMF